MVKVVRVDDSGKVYGGAFDLDMCSMLKTFRVSIESAAKLYTEGFKSFFDLANLVDDFGFPLLAANDEATARYYGCGENSGQWNVLRIMLLKFAWLLRPESDFDYDKEGEIFSKELSSVAVIEAAWLKHGGQAKEPQSSKEPQPSTSGVNTTKAKESKKKSAPKIGGDEEVVRPVNEGDGGKGLKRKKTGDDAEDLVTSTSSADESADGGDRDKVKQGSTLYKSRGKQK